jgi:hypothetical protein
LIEVEEPNLFCRTKKVDFNGCPRIEGGKKIDAFINPF